mmetsp:Transcript_41055/g.118901  ORF Transcript_41055/g.118901 Transcript_41055/m.118901 type:complete len:302 (+) Transcript_41055:355-1260(+)
MVAAPTPAPGILLPALFLFFFLALLLVPVALLFLRLLLLLLFLLALPLLLPRPLLFFLLFVLLLFLFLLLRLCLGLLLVVVRIVLILAVGALLFFVIVIVIIVGTIFLRLGFLRFFGILFGLLRGLVAVLVVVFVGALLLGAGLFLCGGGGGWGCGLRLLLLLHLLGTAILLAGILAAILRGGVLLLLLRIGFCGGCAIHAVHTELRQLGAELLGLVARCFGGFFLRHGLCLEARRLRTMRRCLLHQPFALGFDLAHLAPVLFQQLPLQRRQLAEEQLLDARAAGIGRDFGGLHRGRDAPS